MIHAMQSPGLLSLPAKVRKGQHFHEFFALKFLEEGMDAMGRLQVEKMDGLCFCTMVSKVAVFDDVEGWNVRALIWVQVSFLIEYGNFDYKVTVPLTYCGRVWEN